jgi:hypothetical protein
MCSIAPYLKGDVMGQSKQDSQQSPETAATQKPESAEATGKEGSAHEPKKVHLPDGSTSRAAGQAHPASAETAKPERSRSGFCLPGRRS